MSKLETMEVVALQRSFGAQQVGSRTIQLQPGFRTRRRFRFPFGFFLVVVLPVTMAVVYYGFVAADQYVSEAKFVVHSASRQTPTGLGSFFGSVGISHAPDDAYPVDEYIQSRDAVAMLASTESLRTVFGRPEADFLTSYPNVFYNETFEDLFRRYKQAVAISLDTSSGITTMTVRTFRPGDSRTIARALLAGGEALINKMNGRARTDAITGAETEVANAERRVSAVQTALTQFRTKQNMIDPTKASSGLQDLISRLSTEMAQSKMQLSQLQSAAPRSPQVFTLQTRISALNRQIVEEQSKVVGTDASIATNIGEYERLLLQREFADKSLSSAIGSLEAARIEAQRQQLYLDRVVDPNLPDAPLYPRSLAFVGTILVGALLVYGIGWLLLAGVREHQT